MAKRENGTIESPQGMLGHLSPQAKPMELFLREELARRAEWESRPDVVNKRQQDALDRERMELRKRAANTGEVYGPPDPRRGRLPMTR